MLRKLREIYRQRLWYLFIAPDLILFTIFIIGPALWTLYISLFKWTPRGGSEFIALKNYASAFEDGFFITSFGKAALLTVAITSLSMVLGFIEALLVDDLKGWLKYFTRVAVFTPTVSALVVTGIIWKNLLLPDGLIQNAFRLAGVVTPSWLSDPNLSTLALILMSTWQSVGFNMVFFLAGLQGIPQEFYEAAMVDGASGWDRFRWITLPLMRPVTLFLLVVNSLTNFKMFDQVMALTRGGPMNATLVPMVYIYRLAFSQNRYSYASAVAVLFALCIFGVSLMQLRVLRSQVEY